MSNTALVTGASSGLGKEFARIHAEHGGDLAIVARRADALADLQRELEEQHGIRVQCIPVDLQAPDGPRRVHEALREAGLEIDILINNAGFGGHGKFHERDWNRDSEMIRLNVHALCEITHLVLQGMVARDHGRILNVASMAAFLPGPLQAVYYATKAFVVSFSQAIAEELCDTGITVTSLCPGAVDTEFAGTANVEDVAGFKSMADARDVARIGYDAMLEGRLVVTNSASNTFMKNWVFPFVPARRLLKISRQYMEKK